jgi:hypothetical protein
MNVAKARKNKVDAYTYEETDDKFSSKRAETPFHIITCIILLLSLPFSYSFLFFYFAICPLMAEKSSKFILHKNGSL